MKWICDPFPSFPGYQSDPRRRRQLRQILLRNLLRGRQIRDPVKQTEKRESQRRIKINKITNKKNKKKAQISKSMLRRVAAFLPGLVFQTLDGWGGKEGAEQRWRIYVWEDRLCRGQRSSRRKRLLTPSPTELSPGLSQEVEDDRWGGGVGGLGLVGPRSFFYFVPACL